MHDVVQPSSPQQCFSYLWGSSLQPAWHIRDCTNLCWEVGGRGSKILAKIRNGIPLNPLHGPNHRLSDSARVADSSRIPSTEPMETL